MYTIARFLLVVIVLLGISNVYAMRCGNSVITEGDTEQHLLASCPSPPTVTQDFFKDNTFYFYKFTDGSCYSVTSFHGTVSSIAMSRC